MIEVLAFRNKGFYSRNIMLKQVIDNLYGVRSQGPPCLVYFHLIRRKILAAYSILRTYKTMGSQKVCYRHKILTMYSFFKTVG